MDSSDNENKIIFKLEENSIIVEVKLENETVWLTQAQMSFLFDKDRDTISEHIQNIFKEKELLKESVTRKFQATAVDGKSYNTIHYNLDVIISVGYRVNSKKGTQFRIWATKILKDHIVKGYTLNQGRLRLEEQKYFELQSQLGILKKVYENEELKLDDAKGLIKLITDYAQGLNLLDKFDNNKIEISNLRNKNAVEINYEQARNEIDKLKDALETSDLFGNEKDNGFKSALVTVFQTYDGKDLYPSIEEKAANLLYLIIKNHSFFDGNKRIGAFMFIRFLDINGLLYKENNTKIIEENALVAIALMIAQSDRKEKDLMVKLVVNLIQKEVKSS